MSNVTKLSDAIKFALFVGAASSAASVTAFAQEKDEAKTLDRVEVTGSRIKRVDAETTQPVAVVTRADIEKSGLTNVFDILNNITSSDGSGLSTTTTQTTTHHHVIVLAHIHVGVELITHTHVHAIIIIHTTAAMTHLLRIEIATLTSVEITIHTTTTSRH